MDGEKAQVIGSENDKNNCWIREAKIPRRAQSTMSRDDGSIDAIAQLGSSYSRGHRQV